MAGNRHKENVKEIVKINEKCLIPYSYVTHPFYWK